MTYFEIAYRLLGQYEASGKYINLSLNSHLTDGLSKENKAILTALLYKTVEKKLTYDYYITAISKRSIHKITPNARDAMRLGVCALLDMKSIPDHAAVNEAVGLISSRSERSFVNGVLRTIARQRDNLPLPDKNKNPRKFYSVYYSIPLATVKYMISLLGEESAIAFFEAVNSSDRKISLTVNTTKISVDDFINKLADAGYESKKSQYSSLSVSLSGSHDPRAIDGFSDGEFYVQDEASLLAAEILGASEGEIIVDTCAAPGGKSFALAIISDGKADIRSFDLHESKLSLISSGAERLSLKSITSGVRDAPDPCSDLLGKADAVLCDAPCSGLGVFSKKPDLRYKDITNLSELSELQYKILSESSKYLKAGGRLVYSTCTLRREENEEIVNRFLYENPDFEAVDFEMSGLSSDGGMLTLYQHIHNTDGFFISKLRKKK